MAALFLGGSLLWMAQRTKEAVRHLTGNTLEMVSVHEMRW
jgi:hypothetical protein